MASVLVRDIAVSALHAFKAAAADQHCPLLANMKRVYHTTYGVHFWPVSRTMRTAFSGSVWKKSSVSTPVPSSSSTKTLTHSILKESLT